MSMIKCPECGQNVSTMAGTCPHCGIKISGNIRKCPNCGDYCFNEQEECQSCGAKLSVIITDEAAKPVKQETKTPQQPQEEKKQSHAPRFVIAVMLILVAIVAIYYLDIQKSNEKELRDYERLENVTNPEFYQQFLIDYPDSEHYTEVEDRMHKLMDEGDDWKKVMENKSKTELVKFMQTHPYSNRLRICEDMIDSIDWEEAMTLKTDEALDAYLAKHPEGRFAGEASEKKNEIAKMKISDQDKSLIRGKLESFFVSAMSKQDTGLIADAIPEKMTNFCGKEDATPEQIAEFAKNKMAQDVIGLHYLVGSDLNLRKITLADSSLGFAASFTLEETITRSDANQPSSKTYQVSATLNGELKIVKMNIQ